MKFDNNGSGDFSGWRSYQKALKRRARTRNFILRFPTLVLYSTCTFIILFLLICAGTWISGKIGRSKGILAAAEKKPVQPPKSLSKRALKAILSDLTQNATRFSDHFEFEWEGDRYSGSSTIDLALQDYIFRLLQRSKTLKAAVVAINPKDGRILAMVNYDKTGKKENLCLNADFPAASIFKIVSAAAALEFAGFSPDQPVYFQGRKYTLYKRQLVPKKTGRYTSKTSFKKAFADSINSVFGKLGIHSLGPGIISEYAERFFFNRAIPFDLPVAVSPTLIPEDDFGLAEMASGFNKKTRISPLHAALLASVVANDGMMMAPWLVDRISDEDGTIRHKAQPTQLTSPISTKTATDMKILMQNTVSYGTGRKAFRSIKRSKRFKEIDLGAKTGTINDETDRFKYDWLTVYALPKNEDQAVSVAVLTIHGEKLGLRSTEIGRYIIKKYFSS